MNAIQLYTKEGKPTHLFFCEKCRCVAASEGAANLCCDRKCEKCGVSIDGYWTHCEPCRKFRDAEKEKAVFEKSKKVPLAEYTGGMLFCKAYPGNDGFCTLEDFLDWLDNEAESQPEYVWATNPETLPAFDVDGGIENITSEAFDDAIDHIAPASIEKLRAAAKEFDEANKHIVTYRVDYSTAVILKPQTT